MIRAIVLSDRVIVNDLSKGQSLHSRGYIGSLSKNGLELSYIEAFYLFNKGKIALVYRDKELSSEEFIKKATRKDKRFMLKYKVFEDLRNKGYVIKTALKYGFDFRVYGKGVKPGEEHAKWLVHCFNEDERFDWKRFSQMMRISHGVNKMTLFAVLDYEGDITYWESKWVKL